MRKNLASLFQSLTFISASALIISGCTKSEVNSPSLQAQSVDAAKVAGHHVYGVLPPDPARYSRVAVYNAGQINSLLKGNLKAQALTPEPAVFTLQSPAVRNQEQIGSCTAFTGSADNEILRYYQTGSWPSVLSPLYLVLC